MIFEGICMYIRQKEPGTTEKQLAKNSPSSWQEEVGPSEKSDISWKDLVLSCGLGTGLRPLAPIRPEQLIPIANKPNIQYCVEDLRDARIINIGIILGNVMAEKVQEFPLPWTQFRRGIYLHRPGGAQGDSARGQVRQGVHEGRAVHHIPRG